MTLRPEEKNKRACMCGDPAYLHTIFHVNTCALRLRVIKEKLLKLSFTGEGDDLWWGTSAPRMSLYTTE